MSQFTTIDRPAQTELTAYPPASATLNGHRFYVGYGSVLLAILIAGFGPSFFFRPVFQPFFDLEPLAPSAIAHGIVLTAWFVLFVLQAALVRARNIRLHRLLGIGAAVVAVLGTLEFVWLAIDLFFRRPPDVDGAILEQARRVRILRELTTFALFPTLVGLAIAFRRRSETHKRLMLLATIVLSAAAVSRLVAWPAAFWPELAAIPRVPATVAILASLFAATVVYDLLTRRRVHPAFGWGAPLAFLWTIGAGLIVPALLM